MLELYKTLHPEDKDISEKDLKLVMLENVLLNGQYNDLGIQARDIVLLLIEAARWQMSSGENMGIRGRLWKKPYGCAWKRTY